MLNPILLSLLAVIITVVLIYLDSRVFDNYHSKITYIKVSLLVGGITWLILYIVNNYNTIKTSLSSSSASPQPMINEPIPDVGEFITGDPPF